MKAGDLPKGPPTWYHGPFSCEEANAILAAYDAQCCRFFWRLGIFLLALFAIWVYFHR